MVVLVATPASAEPHRVRVIIEYVEPPTRTDVSEVKRAGGRVDHRYEVVPALAARVPEGAIRGLERKRRVHSVELDQRMEALDYRSTHDWGIAHINADQVHADGNTGATEAGTPIRVAVTDTGIDCAHAELDSNCGLGPSYVEGTNSSVDDNGHGTHVAGAVAAERNALSSGVVGVAPGARALAYKVLDSGGSGYWSDLVAAIDHIWNGGDPRAEVINMSLGGRSAPSTLEEALNRAYGSGILPVAAAGNGGNCGGNNDSTSVPGGYESVVAVAAVNPDNHRPCWSSTGPQVELAGPGVSTFSTWPSGLSSSSHDPQPVCEDGICHYKFGSGTSMASPHVAGGASLVIAAGVTDTNGAYGAADEVRDRLDLTAIDLGSSGRDWQYGHGLLDVLGAVGGGAGGANMTPIASFTYGCQDLSCDFDGSSSADSDGSIASYSWDFGDGATAIGSTVSHTYATRGTYTVTLTVTDDAGATDTESQTVSVSNEATATLTVHSIHPNAIGTGTTSVTICGSGFVSGSTATLEGGKGPTPTATVTGVSNAGCVDGSSPSSLTANVEVQSSGRPGSSQWDARVTNPDDTTAVLVDGLTVTR